MATYPQLIPANAIDTTIPPDEFQQSFADIVGTAATPADGFDDLFNATANGLGDFDTLLTALDGHAADFATAALPLNNALEGDATQSLADTISQGQPDFDGLTQQLTGQTPPAAGGAGGGGGGGGAGANPSDCSQRTNRYGLSQRGPFVGDTCDQHLEFQVLRVQDGPCTYAADPSPAPGSLRPARVISFTLIKGDPSVWELGHGTRTVGSGGTVEVYTVKITPRISGQAASFWAVGYLVTDNPQAPHYLCMSVDVIP